jgi:2-methylisocitrate lyase-like PEP mutase family enzyme
MATKLEKAERFRALHVRDGAFIIPNPWDAGSARLLEALGFEALATTSSGFAQSLGRLDGSVTLDEKAKHCRELASVTDIPISADLENCFADDPKKAASAIRIVADAGVVGASIEDYSGSEIYDFHLAVERVHAAAEVAEGLEIPFTLTARAENMLRGRYDLDDTIRRLQAFAEVGADVLYAPGLKTMDEARQVIQALEKPVNILAPFIRVVSFAELQDIGAKRISIGGALANACIGAMLRAGKEMLESGSFSWLSGMPVNGEIAGMLG